MRGDVSFSPALTAILPEHFSTFHVSRVTGSLGGVTDTGFGPSQKGQNGQFGEY